MTEEDFVIMGFQDGQVIIGFIQSSNRGSISQLISQMGGYQPLA